MCFVRRPKVAIWFFSKNQENSYFSNPFFFEAKITTRNLGAWIMAANLTFLSGGNDDCDDRLTSIDKWWQWWQWWWWRWRWRWWWWWRQKSDLPPLRWESLLLRADDWSSFYSSSALPYHYTEDDNGDSESYILLCWLHSEFDWMMRYLDKVVAALNPVWMVIMMKMRTNIASLQFKALLFAWLNVFGFLLKLNPWYYFQNCKISEYD